MKYSQAGLGRVFIIRLEDGEIVHEEIERFAMKHSIKAAALTVLGGADRGSRLVVGPEQDAARPITPMEHVLDNVREVAGVGTLFPDEAGRPMVHLHMACGREADTVTGCIRTGVRVWQVLEVVMLELVNTNSARVLDADLGFNLLEP